MVKIAEMLQANTAFAGLIGVIVGALISLVGTLAQTVMNQRNEQIIYERTYREKMRNEKKEVYAKCLSELRSIKKQFYYNEDDVDRGNEVDIDCIESVSSMELLAGDDVKNKLKGLIKHKLKDIEVEVFEKEYDELAKAMREDIGAYPE